QKLILLLINISPVNDFQERRRIRINRFRNRVRRECPFLNTRKPKKTVNQFIHSKVTKPRRQKTKKAAVAPRITESNVAVKATPKCRKDDQRSSAPHNYTPDVVVLSDDDDVEDSDYDSVVIERLKL
ncbi:hypothetical protein GJ496_009843, partial [Pomphorhynchus laevis]